MIKQAKIAYNKEYKKKNILKIRVKMREYYSKNRDRILAQMRAYQRAHPQMKKVSDHKYRSKLWQWEQTRKYTKRNFTKEEKCGLCKTDKDLHFHHWRYRIPVQRADFSTLCVWCHALMHRKEVPYATIVR